MPTLNATFRLFNGYSSTADKIISKTDQATNKILNASGATDKFNSRLETTGASAGRASSGLGRFISAAALYMGSLKGMEISDTYTNTSARLDLINDGLQTQAELQQKIFAAADRAKGSYTNMAGAISKMGITASEAFGSNSELIAFTELIQKGFKVGGASQTEQSSAMLQLTQAMGAGKLQGDEFRSIMENAPMIADAIAKYTGKSKGELKQMSADGVITSDIIKNAMFMAADDINDKFADMPYTFGDIWNKVKNGGTKAFGPLITRINTMINSEKFDKFIDNVVGGLNIAAGAADKALDGMIGIYDYVSSNWSRIAPIIEGVTVAWLAYKGALLLVNAAQWAVNFAAMANPISLSIMLVAVLAGAFVLLWEKCEWFRKLYVTFWKSSAMVTANGYNTIATIFDLVAITWNKSIDVFRLFVAALKIGMIAGVRVTEGAISGMIDQFSFLTDAIGLTIKAYNLFAKATGGKTIDFDVNAANIKKAIGYISDKAVGTINGAYSGVDGAFNNAKIDTALKLIDTDKLSMVVDAFGDKMEDFTVSGWLKGLFSEAKGALDGLLPDGENGSPIVVEGLGKGGAIKVDMSNEDLQYLRDIAEREYINKFTNNALAPNIVIQFGDVHEEADANKVAGRIKKILQEEIAMTAEGAY
jgi:tape measure domain-containing protein